MIKVEGLEVTGTGSIIDLQTDIMTLIKSIEHEVSEDTFKIFKETVVFGIFQIFCTDEEVVEMLETYQKFDSYRKEIGHR